MIKKDEQVRCEHNYIETIERKGMAPKTTIFVCKKNRACTVCGHCASCCPGHARLIDHLVDENVLVLTDGRLGSSAYDNKAGRGVGDVRIYKH